MLRVVRGGREREPLFTSEGTEDMSTPPSKTAQAEDQIAQASTLFAYSFAILMSMLVWSFWMTASIQVFATIGLPLYFLYMIQTRPANSSFEARTQIKRALAGDDLPDDDPNKPKGLLHRGFRNITSTIASAAATAGGYTESFSNILFVATVVKVTITNANLEMYWIGCAGRWFYWGAVDTSDKTD